MRQLIIALCLLLPISAAAIESQCPDSYCWDFTTPGTTQTCAVRYTIATDRCQTSCTGRFLGPNLAGDMIVKSCPGLPGYYTICSAYLEFQPTPQGSPETVPAGVLGTDVEGYGFCGYVPATQ